jgi:hypothetical protein
MYLLDKTTVLQIFEIKKLPNHIDHKCIGCDGKLWLGCIKYFKCPCDNQNQLKRKFDLNQNVFDKFINHEKI